MSHRCSGCGFSDDTDTPNGAVPESVEIRKANAAAANAKYAATDNTTVFLSNI